MFHRIKRVKARRKHRCTQCKKTSIKRGDFYLLWVVFPGEKDNRSARPETTKQCAFCATIEAEHDYLLHPLPAEQDHAVYLHAMRNGRG